MAYYWVTTTLHLLGDAKRLDPGSRARDSSAAELNKNSRDPKIGSIICSSKIHQNSIFGGSYMYLLYLVTDYLRVSPFFSQSPSCCVNFLQFQSRIQILRCVVRWHMPAPLFRRGAMSQWQLQPVRICQNLFPIVCRNGSMYIHRCCLYSSFDLWLKI